MQHHLAVEMPTGSLKKFTEQSGQKSHSKANKTSVCAGLTLSVFFHSIQLLRISAVQAADQS